MVNFLVIGYMHWIPNKECGTGLNPRKPTLHVSSPLPLNSALEHDIRREQETKSGLDINGTHQALAYADNVNLIGDAIRTTERNADVSPELRLSTWKGFCALFLEISVFLGGFNCGCLCVVRWLHRGALFSAAKWLF